VCRGVSRAIFLPQLIGEIPELGQPHACATGLNSGVTAGHEGTQMTTKLRNAALNHRQVALDMLGLALRGTLAASLIGALAMGLIALAAS
jgi:hypothetical protein